MAAKTIMEMTPQELIKSLTESIGEYLEARLRTHEISIKAEIKDLKRGLERIEQKLDEKVESQEERLEAIERKTGLSAH